MAAKIPGKWKEAVTIILEEGLGSRLMLTNRAIQNFQDLFPDAFNYQIPEAFVDALANPDLEGNRVYGMTPDGETYEFIFVYRQKPVYGKVCLQKDGRLVVIFSAHRPLKGDTI